MSESEEMKELDSIRKEEIEELKELKELEKEISKRINENTKSILEKEKLSQEDIELLQDRLLKMELYAVKIPSFFCSGTGTIS